MKVGVSVPKEWRRGDREVEEEEVERGGCWWGRGRWGWRRLVLGLRGLRTGSKGVDGRKSRSCTGNGCGGGSGNFPAICEIQSLRW